MLTLVVAGTACLYYFGSFQLRGKMEHAAIESIHWTRSQPYMPSPIKSLLHRAYDAVPHSAGFVVDGGELGRSENAFLAGVPTSRQPIRLLSNHSHLNLFSEKERQSVCVAFKATGDSMPNVVMPTGYFEDPRLPRLRPEAMRLDKWTPYPLAPPRALAANFGQVGANEAHLVSNLAPMAEAFATGVWAHLMRELTEAYPKRFGELWIYVGPLSQSRSSKLATGIPLPDGFYAIAFDMTDAGGLRAISFLVPTDAVSKDLETYITSLATIEQLTGLTFLPEADYTTRTALSAWQSPRLW